MEIDFNIINNAPKSNEAPTTVGAFYDYSEDAVTAWNAYFELRYYIEEDISRYFDSLARGVELLSENEWRLRETLEEVRDLVDGIDSMRVGDIRSNLKEIVGSSMADY